MHREKLEELGRYFDEYMYGDRKQPGTQQAILAFKVTAKDINATESEQLRAKYTLERYIAEILIPDVTDDLNKRQATHPVIVPEKIQPK